MVDINDKAVAGCLWGTAVGDAIGLPCEGLSRRRIQALFGGAPNEHRLIGRRGMISDDTEHTLLVWEALQASGGEGEEFTRHLARGLRRWFLALPAGMGLATLRACGKLCLGISLEHSGVGSAGNGPTMRAAIIGVYCANDETPDRLYDLVRRSTRITHTDPLAEYGARAVAVCAACFARGVTDSRTVLEEMDKAVPKGREGGALREKLEAMAGSIANQDTTERFVTQSIPGSGVSGYIAHTVPVALHAAISESDNFRTAVRVAIHLGGDTDTVAAITGGIVGAHVGVGGIPEEWRTGIWEPAGVLQGRTSLYAVLLLRNLCFAVIVIGHGVRRLLPPYG
jgi:ADP-ribosyl-[dinitrogen reductase] hydrolase